MKPNRELYHGRHRGVLIEVSRHEGYCGVTWCFYLDLIVEQFPEELHADLTRMPETLPYGTIHQPYAECLRGLDWHGEMTFYEHTVKPGYPFRGIRAGCDYAHLWDKGHTYTAEEVMWDAERCVDSLFEKFPTLKTAGQLWDEFHHRFEKDRS